MVKERDNLDNQLQRVFQYEGAQIRTITQDSEPWFFAKDVCEVLELGNVGQALTRLDYDEKNTIILNDGTPGNPLTAIVNEPGLYSLILRSRKPEAKQFKRWITHEVLPAIRQTGTYSAIPQSPTEALLQTVQLMVEQERKLKAIEAAQQQQTEQLTTINHRLDNIDSLDTIGDLRQRLVAMVNKFAHRDGIGFRDAWREFRKAFNTAYRTNLEVRRRNLEEKLKKSISVPEFLEREGLLEDAIRVADKLLNRAS